METLEAKNYRVLNYWAFFCCVMRKKTTKNRVSVTVFQFGQRHQKARCHSFGLT